MTNIVEVKELQRAQQLSEVVSTLRLGESPGMQQVIE